MKKSPTGRRKGLTRWKLRIQYIFALYNYNLTCYPKKTESWGVNKWKTNLQFFIPGSQGPMTKKIGIWSMGALMMRQKN